ncbi:MAG: hypothetical protein ABI863_05555 [Ginsengibacter sp.]
MTLKTFITAILITCMLALCNKNVTTTSKYKGNWEGGYSGAADSGSFAFNIDINGLVKGHVNSNVTSNTFQVIGSVNSNGVLNLPLGNPASGGTFSGKLEDNICSGTWENVITNPTSRGTWSGEKVQENTVQ